MSLYEQFLKEKYAGKYAGCKYPNLIEIYGSMPTDYFANVTPELMLAVFRDEEDLTLEEIRRIAYYNQIPLSVLICPKLIMLDIRRWRHNEMTLKVDVLYMRLKYMAKIERNEEAKKYLGFADPEYQKFSRAVYANRLSYGKYMSVKETFLNYVSWSVPKPKKRGLRSTLEK